MASGRTDTWSDRLESFGRLSPTAVLSLILIGVLGWQYLRMDVLFERIATEAQRQSDTIEHQTEIMQSDRQEMVLLRELESKELETRRETLSVLKEIASELRNR